MTLGFFHKEIERFKHSVVILDDVSLTPLDDQLLGRDTSLCLGSSLTLKVNLPCAKSYRWSDGSRESLLNLDKAGRYWVQVETDCGVVADTIRYESSSVGTS